MGQCVSAPAPAEGKRGGLNRVTTAVSEAGDAAHKMRQGSVRRDEAAPVPQGVTKMRRGSQLSPVTARGQADASYSTQLAPDSRAISVDVSLSDGERVVTQVQAASLERLPSFGFGKSAGAHADRQWHRPGSASSSIGSMARESGGSFRASDAPERFRATGKGGRFEAIKELSRVVTSSSGTIGELLRVLRWQSQQLVDSDRCSLFVLNQQGTHVWTILDDGKVIQIPSHSGLVGRCITDCRVVNIADAYSEDGFNRNVDQETGYRTKSVLVVPVRQDGGQMLGALQVINKLSADTFTAEDADVLEAFASVSAMAIVNMQKVRR